LEKKIYLRRDFLKFFDTKIQNLQEKAALPLPPPYHSYYSAGFDWLGVELEVRSLRY
jgi:hypothetical protein